VFLKSLTLKGFKSFADPAVLEFEPGITVVVGPNGSGKSNVVDAVAWVLGAQGPRTVRSAKMEDVIFMGTANRPALGRAEVALTIDNSSGTLGTDLAEITITRTLFRSGDSEYSLNGAPCRLLDIQELLSDTGVGRQQHVIISQGHLDAILEARPEDRRSSTAGAASAPSGGWPPPRRISNVSSTWSVRSNVRSAPSSARPPRPAPTPGWPTSCGPCGCTWPGPS